MRPLLGNLLVRTALGASFAALALGRAAPASAEGMQGHMFVTEEAAKLVKTPALKALLERERDGYLVGSIFPDSGYWAMHEYGEESHWEPFVEAYLQWIRAHYAPPFTEPEAARHVAVLMGIASHVMSDQVFDILFLDKVGEVSGDSAKSQLDTHIDFFLVDDRDRRINPTDVTDADVLASILRDALGVDASAATIRSGIGLAKSGIGGVIAGTNILVVGPMRLTNGWASDNYLNESVPGSYPHNARVVAGYFETLWRRLHGRFTHRYLIAGSNPEPRARAHSTNHASLDSYVTLFAGDPLRAETLRNGGFVLRDGEGNVVSAHLRSRRDGHQEATTLQLKPAQDLAYNSWYRVALLPGVTTVRGDVLEREVGFWFKTQCPPAPEPCPQVPEPPEEPAWPEDEEDDAGVDPSEPDADAGVGSADAGTTPGEPGGPVDAGTTPGEPGGPADAGSGPHAPMPGEDAAATPDAGETDVDIDPVMPGESSADGCSCSVPGSGNRTHLQTLSTSLFLLLFGAPFWRRRRR